jgi:hypothetical protein
VVLDFFDTGEKYVLEDRRQYSAEEVSTWTDYLEPNASPTGRGPERRRKKLEDEEAGSHRSAEHRGAVGHF